MIQARFICFRDLCVRGVRCAKHEVSRPLLVSQVPVFAANHSKMKVARACSGKLGCR